MALISLRQLLDHASRIKPVALEAMAARYARGELAPVVH